MDKTVLVTGGAGFIGSHLSGKLCDTGYKVRIIDNLSPQVHGEDAKLPRYLEGKVELIQGDILNREEVERAVHGVDAVIHLAAETGVGQSMYEITRYIDVNTKGAAILLEKIVKYKDSLSKVILASSRAVYGEGIYQCKNCGVVYPEQRGEEKLRRKQWQLYCPKCGRRVAPIPTNEDAITRPTSIYAVSKLAQEQLFSVIAGAYKIPTVILRYFNVYGTGQSLNNPYTGILSIFASRILNRKPPEIYEDGLESRDFVHVTDVVKATMLALEKDEANYQVLNVGCGQRETVLEVAKLLVEKLGSNLEPVHVGKYRVGDIRHCYADLTRIRSKLGYEPSINIEEGITDFANWVKKQKNVVDLYDLASEELARWQLLKEM